MISRGKTSVTLEDVYSKWNDSDILHHYLGITEIPCVICSPIREDNKPSFGLYSTDGVHIHWLDYANREKGGTFDLLCKIWGVSIKDAMNKVYNEMSSTANVDVSTTEGCKVTMHLNHSDTELKCKVRPWRDWDLEYWNKYGISREWLEFADVYPISYKIIIKEGIKMVMPADKYAYAYVERKEGKVTLKIYQPFNKEGYKWSNKHNKSVISLWTKLPREGDKVCICSSLKDALCLWANTGIPSIAIQGEAYSISSSAITELKNRFKKVFIMLDNDKEGLYDACKLAESTGFVNIVLPQFPGGKDISDYFYHLQDQNLFKQNLLKLFNQL